MPCKHVIARSCCQKASVQSGALGEALESVRFFKSRLADAATVRRESHSWLLRFRCRSRLRALASQWLRAAAGEFVRAPLPRSGRGRAAIFSMLLPRPRTRLRALRSMTSVRERRIEVTAFGPLDRSKAARGRRGNHREPHPRHPKRACPDSARAPAKSCWSKRRWAFGSL